jgi:hypothetical protein
MNEVLNATMSAPPPGQPLATLLELARRARQAADNAELSFIAVNDSHQLAPYRQAFLWFADGGIVALSGVVQMEANVPYVQWAARVARALQQTPSGPRTIVAGDLPRAEADEWAEWLPAHGLWLPFQAAPDATQMQGGLLLARDAAWEARDIALLTEWADMWHHAWLARHKPKRWSWRNAAGPAAAGAPLWKQRRARWAAAVVAVLLVPVRLTVLAPGELVPSDPAVIRAPFDGVVASFAVKPNDLVKADQPLFAFDQATMTSRLEVARQALITAEAEYRQSAQMAVSDQKYKGQLALLTGKIEERRAEADYLQAQLTRASVVAPRDGIALFDDPSEWLGKPVVTGERIMRIAAGDDMEIEAWLAVGDAIPLQPDSPVSLYLNATPLFPVAATVRYMAHDAVQRADGSYAYRIRARLTEKTGHRVGLKGTAKLRGGWVPLCYWMMRRPLAAIRQFTGW